MIASWLFAVKHGLLRIMITQNIDNQWYLRLHMQYNHIPLQYLNDYIKLFGISVTKL